MATAIGTVIAKRRLFCPNPDLNQGAPGQREPPNFFLLGELPFGASDTGGYCDGHANHTAL